MRIFQDTANLFWWSFKGLQKQSNKHHSLVTLWYPAATNLTEVILQKLGSEKETGNSPKESNIHAYYEMFSVWIYFMHEMFSSLMKLNIRF